MYLRFITLSRDNDSRHPQGLIVAAHQMMEEGDFDRYELETVKRILTWFNQHLKSPPLLEAVHDLVERD